MACLHPENQAWPNLARGEWVKGTYFGLPFTGTVIHDRAHTINRASRLITVALDKPLVIDKDDGCTREEIMVVVCGACLGPAVGFGHCTLTGYNNLSPNPYVGKGRSDPALSDAWEAGFGAGYRGWEVPEIAQNASPWATAYGQGYGAGQVARITNPKFTTGEARNA